MPLQTFNITGSLKDADGNPLTIGTVTFTPYATHDARVDGSNALLGPIIRDIATLPNPLTITAGNWTITIATKAKVDGRDAFKTITTAVDISADTTWGSIVGGAVASPAVTPTHVQQAQAAADEAEMWAAQSSAMQDAAVETLVNDTTPSATRTALDGVYVNSSALDGLTDARARRLYLTGQTLASVQTWLNGIASGDVAQLVGSISVNNALTVPAGVTLDLSAATITQTATAVTTIQLGAGSAVRGGTINCPATWDATNSGDVIYGVVHAPPSADKVTVDGVTINNVYKAGINLREVHDATVTNCRIYGNVPESMWTGVETGNFGIRVDAPVWTAASNSGGGVKITNNIIQTTVQGVMLTNFGTGTAYGTVITGNRFYGCHNHGVYSQVNNLANTITGNVFFRCQKPVVTYGAGHVIANNSMFTPLTGGLRDHAGISCRDALDCVIEGNSITQEAAGTNIPIQLDQNAGTEISRNVIRGNTVNLTGTGGQPAIRIGSAETTETCRDNRIEGNVIKGAGVSGGGGGVILVTCGSAFLGRGNVVTDNTVVSTGDAHVVNLVRQNNATVQGNTIRLEYNAPSPTALYQIRLEVVTDSLIVNNLLLCSASYGTNVTLTGVRETTATSNRNILGPNLVHHSTTLLTASTPAQKSGALSMIATAVGGYAAATTLGSVTGKVEVRDGKGDILGYLPVYGSIT